MSIAAFDGALLVCKIRKIIDDIHAHEAIKRAIAISIISLIEDVR